MYFFQFILGSFVLTAVFQEISSQQCSCQHRSENPLGSLPPSATEFLCKDLASAIQNTVLAKMRRTGSAPSVLGPFGLSGPSITASGPSTSFITPNSVTNSVKDIPNPGTCPVCARKWQNALATILGMTTGQNSAVPLSVTTSVNVPLPYNVQTTQRNKNIHNAYPELVRNIGANSVVANNFAVNNAVANSFGVNNAVANNNFAINNAVASNYAVNNAGTNSFEVNNAVAKSLAALLSKSMPNNANNYPEVVMITNNGLRN